MAAGILNSTFTPSFRPSITRYQQANGRARSLRLSAQSSETPSAASSTYTSSNERPTTPVPSFSPPPNFKPPQPRPFSVRPDQLLEILAGSLALIFRLGTGALVSGYSASFVPKNEIPSDKYALEIAGFKLKETSKLGPLTKMSKEMLFEFYDSIFYGLMHFCLHSICLVINCVETSSSCPFCRKVREIVSILDLDVIYYPCPRNGPNFRPKVAEMGGKQQFPYMVDPNTGVAMYESDAIIEYLVGKYGDGNVPLMLSLGLLTTLTEAFAMIGRMGKGSSYVPAKLPPKPLEIWAYEPSPFCKVVREILVELELPHLLRSCARGSPKRQILYEKAGHFQVPYLEDPNTGVQMFESAEIVEYLKATYAR